MTTHQIKTTVDCACQGDVSCSVCSGGLFICKVCGGAEGSLPTECPGKPMTSDEEDAVYAGRHDFVNGEWRK